MRLRGIFGKTEKLQGIQFKEHQLKVLSGLLIYLVVVTC
jgi:hypothetical protein